MGRSSTIVPFTRACPQPVKVALAYGFTRRFLLLLISLWPRAFQDYVISSCKVRTGLVDALGELQRRG